MALVSKTDWVRHSADFLKFVLAVCLGFFVDNYREKYMERSRAEELSIDLKQDFIEDTIYLSELIHSREVKSRHMDSLSVLMQSEIANVNMQSLYQHSAYVADSPIYRRNNTTFQQMTNAGYLSFFSKEIEKILTEYDVLCHETRDMMFLETESITRKIYPFQQQIFHVEHFNGLIEGKVAPEVLKISSWDPEVRRVYMNYIFEMDMSSKQLCDSYRMLLEKARQILTVLNKAYPQ